MNNILVIDVGGSKLKVMVTGETERRKIASGPTLSAAQMVADARMLAEGWHYDVVTIGYPGPVLNNRVAAEPKNLGVGWVGFDFPAALGCPVKMINDAAMQALGGYRGGKMLFLGLGTGLGSAMIVDGVVEPAELGHLPYKKNTYEHYLGQSALEKAGRKKWTRRVFNVIEHLQIALEPDEILLGGGNVKKLDELPAGCRRGDNADAFTGGFRLWTEPAMVTGVSYSFATSR